MDRAPRRTASSLALAALLTLVLPGVAGAATRYAGPDGNGPEPCAQANPCSLKVAVANAPSDQDSVVVLPGRYVVSESVIATKRISIAGVPGESRPRIEAADGFNGSVLVLGAAPGDRYEVHRLQISSNSSGLVLLAPGYVSDLVLLSQGAGASGLVLGASGDMRVDNVFAHVNGQAAAAVTATDGTSTVRNVTAIALGTNSHGLQAVGTCTPEATPPFGCTAPFRSPTVELRNVIVSGVAGDILSTSSGTGTAATVRVAYSNFDQSMQSGNGVVIDEGNNQAAPPQFLPASFLGPNFHQSATSPTIDAGVNDSLIGATDLDGNPRVMGAAPDIGADEFVPPNTPGGGTGGGSDGDGGGTVGTGGTTGDTVVPVLDELALAPQTFRAARTGASIAARIGSTVFYAVTEAATVRFTVQRAVRGRRVGGRCVKPTLRNRKLPRCIRWRRLSGSFKHQATQETNRFRFTGRVGGRRLRPGRYRLSARPADAAGNRGSVRRARFRIVLR